MSKAYTKVILTKGSDYTGVGAWKPKGDKAPAALMASTMEFELNTAEMTPGKYRISFWKGEKKTDKSPDGNFLLERVVDDEASPAGATTAGAGATPDFNF